MTASSSTCAPPRRRICSTAAALVLALAVLVPALLGYQRYVITSGSMTGTYDRGSLVFDKRRADLAPQGRRRHHLPPRPAPPGSSRTASSRSTAVDGKRELPTKGDANRVRRPWGRSRSATASRRASLSTFPTSATRSPCSASASCACSSSGSPRCSSRSALARLWRDAAARRGHPRRRRDLVVVTARRRCWRQPRGAGLAGDVHRVQDQSARRSRPPPVPADGHADGAGRRQRHERHDADASAAPPATRRATSTSHDQDLQRLDGDRHGCRRAP